MREEDLKLRLVVPTTLIDETLLNCHLFVEGGHQGILRTFHRVKSDFYGTVLYADVAKHIQACEDCSTIKSTPYLRGHSTGNVVSGRPFQVESMDFVIPLPTTRRGTIALLLFQDYFTGFVIAKDMDARGVFAVAEALKKTSFAALELPASSAMIETRDS